MTTHTGKPTTGWHRVIVLKHHQPLSEDYFCPACRVAAARIDASTRGWLGQRRYTCHWDDGTVTVPADRTCDYCEVGHGMAADFRAVLQS